MPLKLHINPTTMIEIDIQNVVSSKLFSVKLDRYAVIFQKHIYLFVPLQRKIKHFTNKSCLKKRVKEGVPVHKKLDI